LRCIIYGQLRGIVPGSGRARSILSWHHKPSSGTAQREAVTEERSKGCNCAQTRDANAHTARFNKILAMECEKDEPNRHRIVALVTIVSEAFPCPRRNDWVQLPKTSYYNTHGAAREVSDPRSTQRSRDEQHPPLSRTGPACFTVRCGQN